MIKQPETFLLSSFRHLISYNEFYISIHSISKPKNVRKDYLIYLWFPYCLYQLRIIQIQNLQILLLDISTIRGGGRGCWSVHCKWKLFRWDLLYFWMVQPRIKPVLPQIEIYLVILKLEMNNKNVALGTRLVFKFSDCIRI